MVRFRVLPTFVVCELIQTKDGSFGSAAKSVCTYIPAGVLCGSVRDKRWRIARGDTRETIGGSRRSDARGSVVAVACTLLCSLVCVRVV